MMRGGEHVKDSDAGIGTQVQAQNEVKERKMTATKTESKTAQAKRIREENAKKKAEQNGNKATFPHSEEVQKAVEAEKDPKVDETVRKSVTKLMAGGKISAESYSKVLSGLMTEEEAIEKGPAKKEAKKPAQKYGELGNPTAKKMKGVEYGHVEMAEDQIVWVKGITYNVESAGKTLARVTPYENKEWGVLRLSMSLDEVEFVTSNQDIPATEKIVEVEKEVEKPVYKGVPEDATIRQEIEDQYRQTVVDTQGAGVDTQPYIRVQNSLKKLAEKLELGIDFQELENYIPPKKKGDKK